MSDLGSIATSSRAKSTIIVAPNFVKRIVCGTESLVLGGRDNAEGNPDPPSLLMTTKGTFPFRWTVKSGARIISVDVKQAINSSPRPSLVIKTNTEIGVNIDIEQFANPASGWITIGPVSVSPSSDGVLLIELRANYDGQYVPCYWDNIITG